MLTDHFQEEKMLRTIRRIQTVGRVLSPKKTTNDCKVILNDNCNVFCRHESTFERYSSGRLKIGDVEKTINVPQHPQYVPTNYLCKDLSQSLLSDLKWMLQKDKLGQDIFLIGRPGSQRRHLAMAYSQLTQREVEFVSLSRDTTEADLKQRREIINGCATYIDQSAVKAAVEGRILVLEGIEKAERNVLPVLNNLLENREMHLEDGRFLIAPQNYDKLMKEHGKEYLDKWNLIRVHEDFRVIALGLPVPNYIGNPLDPPLRSRFQARDVHVPPFYDTKEMLTNEFPTVETSKFDQLLSCAYALMSDESKAIGLLDFPIDNLRYAAKILSVDPSTDLFELFNLMYPFRTVLAKEGCAAVSNALSSFRIKSSDIPPHLKLVERKVVDDNACVVYVNNNVAFEVRKGEAAGNASDEYIPLAYHEHRLVNLFRNHAAGDFCLVGPSGCGKSRLVKKFADTLDYDVEPIILYQDMTARDLIQQRETLSNGDTVWRNSPLVNAALEGKIALLDGLHRVHTSTIATLQRLIYDRELQLYDGQRLLRHDRYDYLVSAYGAEAVQTVGLRRIHPSFRIIALAENPGNYNSQWLTSETLSYFPVHELRSLNQAEKLQLIEATTGRVNAQMKNMLNIVDKLQSSTDPALASVAASLSTRQLLRIAKRFANFDGHDIFDTIQRACLAKFLPTLTRQALNTMLFKCGIEPSRVEESKSNKCRITDDDAVVIGDTKVQRYQTADSAKVPNVLFYDLPQHTKLLEQMLQDFSIGEHLLLVGNQGVGKNKLTDKLLQMLNRPREYIQLHRDTTVQSLTMQPTIVDGFVKYEDSPLVKAIVNGRVLVVDEADKAPTHVTCILKTLVESGEMMLSDGRRIVPSCNSTDGKNTSKRITTHRHFRMIVLANRPGFPFLGNNLFAVLGDLFSCHIIDNPSAESEIQLLKRYGPNVETDTIAKIVKAFGELRELADKGLVSYPYSTREAVNIVKHLQAYPDDGLAEAVNNVFDFDRYSGEMLDVLQRVLLGHNIPVELVGVRKRREDGNIQMTIERDSGLDVSGPKHGKVDEKGDPHVGGNTWAGGTGGRDTAGLGGKGGPYRLDAGHTVHQLSDEEKNAVPEHIKKAAREMGLKAFKDRLKEIRMSEYDAKLYEQFSGSVRSQVQALRIILSNLQAKSKERQWTRHQTSGELDDTKLVEGITGERAIYRRRTDVEPELGAPQMKPKRLKLVVDVSGSMYRFNGYDGRLDREMEAVVMVMEAFQGYEAKIQYDIVGHSGESDCIVFVAKEHPPGDNKQRLEIIRTMHAHAQFCMSGDYTLEAIRGSVRKLDAEKDEFDEGIVVVLSDANLSRYGIAPKRLADVLLSSDHVSAYAIFIGSLGDQAARLTRALPAGRGFVCMNLENIPQIIQQIFTSSLLRSNK